MLSIPQKSIGLLMGGVIFLVSCFAAQPLFAAEDRIVIGLGAGAQLPQEKDLESDGVPVDLYLDWESIYLRVGATSYATKLENTVSGANWEHSFKQNAAYLAARVPYHISDSFDAFAMLGAAYVATTFNSSNLDSGYEAEEEKVSGAGVLTGGGLAYYMGSFGLGFQYVFIGKSATLADSDFAVGTNEFLLTLALAF